MALHEIEQRTNPTLSDFRDGWDAHRNGGDRRGGAFMLGWHYAERYAREARCSASDLPRSRGISMFDLNVEIERAMRGMYAKAVRNADTARG